MSEQIWWGGCVSRPTILMGLQSIKNLPNWSHGSLLTHQSDVRPRITLHLLEQTHTPVQELQPSVWWTNAVCVSPRTLLTLWTRMTTLRPFGGEGLGWVLLKTLSLTLWDECLLYPGVLCIMGCGAACLSSILNNTVFLTEIISNPEHTPHCCIYFVACAPETAHT